MRKLWILCLMVSLVAMTSFAQTSKKTTDQKATSTKSADHKSTAAKADKADTAKTDTAKTSGKTAPAGKMDVNTASKDDLEKLPGIGPATSQKIVDGRPYKTKRDLLTKKVVGQAEYDKIKDNIIAHQDSSAAAEKSSTTKATSTKKK
jgi:competence protein ComEA